jgi:hypothetical protein
MLCGGYRRDIGSHHARAGHCAAPVNHAQSTLRKPSNEVRRFTRCLSSLSD